MKGSRVLSRPTRQARNGVTYKESDEDEEEFVPNVRLPSAEAVCRRSSLRNSVGEVEELGIAKGKRTLTLKRARTVEPPLTVGKDDVYFHTIQEEEKSTLSPDIGRKFRHVVDSAQGVPNSLRESSAFDYLLEAVSGASADGEDEGASVGKRFSSPKKAGQSEDRNDQEVRSTSNRISSVSSPSVPGLQSESCVEEMTSTAYVPEPNAGYATYERKVLPVKGVKSEHTDETNAFRRSIHCSDEESILVNSSVGHGMKSKVESERDKEVAQEGISFADEKKYCRRGERDKQSSMSSSDEKKFSKEMVEERQESVTCVRGKKDSKKSEEDMQDGVPLTHRKKGREDDEEKLDDMCSADEGEEDDEEDDSWNESLDASDAENKRPVKGKNKNPSPAKKPSQELKTFVKKSKVTKKVPGTPGRVLLPAKSTSVPPLLPKKRPGLWAGSKPFVPPGPVNLQSPIVAHRRVVGLSRRHRPPPLHPYLLGS